MSSFSDCPVCGETRTKLVRASEETFSAVHDDFRNDYACSACGTRFHVTGSSGRSGTNFDPPVIDGRGAASAPIEVPPPAPGARRELPLVKLAIVVAAAVVALLVALLRR